MTMLRHIELTCPVCMLRFSTQSVLSTNSFGGKRTDFHERAAGTQPLPYQVHLCTRCGYAGSERSFTEAEDIGPDIKGHVWDELAPRISASAVISGSEKYEHAAKCALYRGEDARHLADLYLRAAWCCVDERDTEAERYFRRLAAWKFAEALEGFDGVPTDERAVITYLVGELWRRVGDMKLAHEWYDAVPKEIVDAAGQKWIADAALQQKQCPREWFG